MLIKNVNNVLSRGNSCYRPPHYIYSYNIAIYRYNDTYYIQGTTVNNPYLPNNKRRHIEREMYSLQ